MFIAHQPYFFPWLGYFAKILHADTFVVMDDSQFRKRHHYDRTRIIGMHGQPMWLRASVGEHLGQTCAEAKFSTSLNVSKLAQTVYESYATAHYRHLRLDVTDILAKNVMPGGSFLEGCLGVIDDVLDLLELAGPTRVLASALQGGPADPTGRLITFSEALDDSTLLVGNGRFKDVHDVTRLTSRRIRVIETDFLHTHPVYTQARRRREPFIKGLSVIDSLLNAGKRKTAFYISDRGEENNEFDGRSRSHQRCAEEEAHPCEVGRIR